jgi:hypothetical protein
MLGAIMFQRVGMAHLAMANMDMVTFRMDWARRSRAAMEKGPYPTEVIGRMQYEYMINQARIIY